MKATPISQEEKVTITVSPVARAEELFILARHLNRRFRWPYFQITDLANGCAMFATTQDGWECLRQALQENLNDPLSIVSVEGNRVHLHMTSITAVEDNLRAPVQGEVEET